MSRTAFGRWLEDQIARIDTNVVGLAKMIGVSHVSVSRWMSGIADPRPENVRAMARVFSVRPETVYRAMGYINGAPSLSPRLERMLEKLQRVRPDQQEFFETMLDHLLVHTASETEDTHDIEGSDD